MRPIIPGICLSLAASADTLILRDGTYHTGDFIRGTSREILFHVENGRTERFPIASIRTVRFEVQSIFAPRTEGSRNRVRESVTESDRNTIETKYAQLGGASGILGPPSSEEETTPDGIGRFRHYRDSSIYWSPQTGAHEIHGAIRERWAALGWEQSPLGYPTSDEKTASDGAGKYQEFQKGVIYWHPRTGAYPVSGAVLEKWRAANAERGQLGYPTTAEAATERGGGRFQHFQDGSIFWHPHTGSRIVTGAIRDHWAKLGWEQGWLGFPTSEARAVADGSRQDFQGGYIIASWRNGVKAYSR